MQAHFETRMQVEDTSIRYHSLARAQSAGYGEYSRLPYCLKIVLENLLRFYDEDVVGEQDLKALGRWLDKGGVEHEIAFHPARVLMQDFTGVPAIADLGAMRDAMAALGKDPGRVNPLIPVDLVIDHSVMVDQFATKDAFAINVEREFARNGERYAFLRWGQQAFDNFRVVPPGTGICHQVNLEYLSQLVCLDSGDPALAFPDTVLGTDSHTTMVNALGVLGWGVGGIEAEAAMLGQPVSMLIPAVVGMRFEGKLRPGVLATDLVLRVVERLREAGVVSKFVEFFGPGLDHLTLADRATIANMAPEYGATCGIFSIDQETMRYLHLTGRSPHQIACVEAYGRAQGLVRSADMDDAIYSEIITLDLEAIKPAIAGPKRPQDRVELEDAPDSFQKTCQDFGARAAQPIAGSDAVLEDGAVVIAAITSCTNTSNPTVMIAAGLLAQKACERGLSVKPWTKTSLAPGSQVVMDYLEQAGLDQALDQLGFHLVGYGCMTCIGNSGPLPPAIAAAVHAGDLTVCSVLSGNRNFEGRINPGVKANYLASPPLVVAYALAGTMKINLTSEPLGLDQQGQPVMLADLWPGDDEVQAVIQQTLSPEMFQTRYDSVFTGPAEWQLIDAPQGKRFEWGDASTYIQRPPFFDQMRMEPEQPEDIIGAKILAMLGSSITTDHISPAGSFAEDSPAGEWLRERQVRPADFNSYGTRRGNHQVMMRGTFANIRIRNELVPGQEGGYTRYGDELITIYDAAQRYEKDGTPLIIVAGAEYGTGSSRDWAAKGPRLLGVKAVLAESFERIHRTNLIGMGILPLQFTPGVTRKTLHLDGSEQFDLTGLAEGVRPKMAVQCRIQRADGSTQTTELLARIDTEAEARYFLHGGILHYVLRRMAKAA